MISKRFIKSSVLYTIAGSLPTASAIILLPFYLHSLSTDNYGALAIYMAFSAFIQIIVGFSFDTSIYIHYHDFKNDKHKLASFTSSMFMFMLIIGLVIGTIFSIAGEFVFQMLKDVVKVKQGISFYPYGLMSVATGIFQSIFKVYSSFLQTREKPVQYFWSNVLQFSFIATFTIIGLHLFPQTLAGPVGGRMIATSIGVVWVLVHVIKEFGFHFDYALLRSSFDFNRASLIYQLQQWSINYLDRFIMIFFMPLSQIGVYDFAVKCMMAIDFIIGGLYNSFYPKIIGIVTAQAKKQSTIEINRYYHGLTAAIMTLVCSAVLFFSFIIDKGFVKQGYEQSLQYFPYIGIIYLVRALRYYFVFPYGVLKHIRPLPVIYLIVSSLKISVVLLLIKNYGVYAVIFATVVSSLIEIVMLWIFVRDKFEFKFNALKLIIVPSMLAVALGLSYLLRMHNNVWMYFIYLLICIGLLWWVYRNEIKHMKLPSFIQKYL